MKNEHAANLLDILASWLDDNINCESELLFDNDDDATDSELMYPAVERASAVLRKVESLSSENNSELRARLMNAVKHNATISADDVRSLLLATDHLISSCESGV
ncbi:hypothetical protein K9692_004771 [Escherichia coli]|jgi:hypothetical protein|uniref:hypothetical protein n=1 Tax=Buttiauxella gaviniae TaxID=82990 RepID=UPI001D53D768|nr:hypothetical protein [Escherichia coli]